MCFDQVLGAPARIKQNLSASESASYNAQLSRDSAALEEEKARSAEATGKSEASKHRTKVQGMIGQQRAAFGASGTVADEGSNFDVIADTARFGEMDALEIESNYNKQAWGHRVEAVNYRNQGTLFDTQASKNKMYMHQEVQTLLTGDSITGSLLGWGISEGGSVLSKKNR